MKKAANFHLLRGLLILSVLISCLALPPRQAPAQEYGTSSEEMFTREEISQMLAPVALYPDPLLAQILMAATYPLELVEADRWVRRNPQVQGDALDAALLHQDWDPSVKALSHFPSILALMSERITETTDLGNAFLAQEPEVMATVQELRAKAHAQGNLTTTSQQKVIVEKETIIIQPANPRVIYVPYYDPFYVYGPWWYPAYPPSYWGPSGVRLGLGISYWPGTYFGFTFGSWSYFDWHRHHIYIDVYQRPRFVRQDRWVGRSGRWHHLPVHRRGVAYHHPATAIRYGQSPQHATGIRRDSRANRSDRGRSPGLGVERIRTERAQRGNDRSRLERQRQDRQRLERGRQQGAPAERDRQVRERTERERQVREGTARDQQERAARDRQTRERAGREQQVREKANSNRQQSDGQLRQRTEREKGAREEVERGRQQGNRDNRSRQVENGRGERLAKERGQVSRKESNQNATARGRAGDADGGRNQRGTEIRTKRPQAERGAVPGPARQQR